MSLLISVMYIIFDTAFAVFLMVKKKCLFDISDKREDDKEAVLQYLLTDQRIILWCAVTAAMELFYSVSHFFPPLSVPLIKISAFFCFLMVYAEAYFTLGVAEIMANCSKPKVAAVIISSVVSWSGLIIVTVLLSPPNL